MTPIPPRMERVIHPRITAAIRYLKRSSGVYVELIWGCYGRGKERRRSFGRLDGVSPTAILDQVVRVAWGDPEFEIEELIALKIANKSARW